MTIVPIEHRVVTIALTIPHTKNNMFEPIKLSSRWLLQTIQGFL
jgi:hypothetical protein